MTEPDPHRATAPKPNHAPYALATGSAAVRRLHALHEVYSPFARGVLAGAGLKAGMNVADFGCGVGMTTRMLAEMVGPSGSVTGVDFSTAQVEEAREISTRAGIDNVSFLQANACETGLPRAYFDLAYCSTFCSICPIPQRVLRRCWRFSSPAAFWFWKTEI